MKSDKHSKVRISASRCPSGRRLSAGVLAAAAVLLYACAPTPVEEPRTTTQGAGEVEVSQIPSIRYRPEPTLEAMAHYLNLGEGGRKSLRKQWAAAHAAGNSAAGLRYALALAVVEADEADLKKAENVLTTLIQRDALDDDARTLARLTVNNVRNRLASLDERRRLLQQRNNLQAELERAKQQIEQLTRIEQDLEPETPPPTEQPPPAVLPDGLRYQ